MNDFTYTHYKKILSTLKQHKFDFLYFPNFSSSESPRKVLMRHDIDLSVDHALKMAEIEHDLGVKATYFFRLNSTFYHPTSQHDYPSITRILSLGHQLGLHFDPGFYEANNISINDGIARDIKMLEAAFDREIAVLSQHRPAMLGQAPVDASYAGKRRYFTYEDTFIKTAKYLSDSGQSWRENDPLAHIEEHSNFHILVHPIWWSETHTPWEQCLAENCNKAKNVLDKKTDILTLRYRSYLLKRQGQTAA